MEKIFNSACMMIGLAGGLLAALFGAWNAMFKALIVIMILDYVTGIIKAVIKKNISSKIGFDGILKKVMVLAVVVLANMLELILNDNIAIREIVIMFYIANEGISVLENVAAVSNKMPPGLKKILLQLRGDGDENRH